MFFSSLHAFYRTPRGQVKLVTGLLIAAAWAPRSWALTRSGTVNSVFEERVEKLSAFTRMNRQRVPPRAKGLTRPLAERYIPIAGGPALQLSNLLAINLERSSVVAAIQLYVVIGQKVDQGVPSRLPVQEHPYRNSRRVT